MGDIAVQRGTATATTAGATTAPASNFGSLASTIVWNQNNRYAHAGRSDQNATNLDGDDMSGGLHLSAVDTIDIGREPTGDASPMRFEWESWEYVGSPGGANEFIVRGRYQLTLTGETTTAVVPGIVDIDDCVPIITGLFVNSTNDDASHSTAICWLSGTDTLNVKRGGGSSDTVRVWVTVVEFTGSAWDVKHGRAEGTGADSGTVTLVDAADGVTAGGGDVTDWGQAFIHHHYVGNALNGVDDAISDNWPVYTPGAGTTSVAYAFNANHVDSAGAGSREEHFVHVIRHPGMQVTRISDSISSAGANNLAVSIANTAEASVKVSRTSSGTGTAYGRGWVNARIVSTTVVELWVHRSGNTINTQVQLISLVGVAALFITDVDGDEVLDVGQLDVVLTGAGFEAVQGTGLVEIGDDPDYASATRVTQAIDSWSDTSIQFDLSTTGLAEGVLYLFVTNDSGDRSGSFAVNVGRLPYRDILIQLGVDHLWLFDGSTADEVGGNAADSLGSVGPPDFVADPICRGNTQRLRLDAVSERFEATDSPRMNISNQHTARTLGGWLILNGVQLALACPYKEGGGVNNMCFLVGMGNQLTAQLADTGDMNIQAYADKAMRAGRPAFVVMKFDGSSRFDLYIDGELQARTDGNPPVADMDTHSGDIVWGDSDTNLDMGGTDVPFAGMEDAGWAAFFSTSGIDTGGAGQWTAANIETAFLEGAIPTVTITADTEANMQTALDALASTVRPDAPVAIAIEPATDTADPTLTLDNVTFDPDVTVDILWLGSGTLTIRNSGTSNAARTKSLGVGTVAILETALIEIEVQDVATKTVVPGARVRVAAGAGGPLTAGTELINAVTDGTGRVSVEIDYTADQPIEYRVRKGSVSPFYRPTEGVATVLAAGVAPVVFLVSDE